MTPFHWAVEFPEVFVRENPGFDAIVGNPPFAGKNTIIAGNRAHYLPWLQTLHAGAHGNADLVAHFYRRAFGFLRKGGAFGLIAANTIGQGDTRATGLAAIIGEGGVIARATRRLKWPLAAAARRRRQERPKIFRLHGARARFLRFFPNGFHSAGYAAQERDYKLAAKAKLDATVPLDKAMDGSGYGEAVLAVFRATNMLSPFEKTRLQDVLRGPRADDFVRAAARFARYGGKANLLDMEQALKPHDNAKWTVVTYLPYLWRPDVHMSLKPEATKDFAARVGHRFADEYEPRLRLAVYDSLLDLVAKTAAALADLAPRDRIDIQSFIWVVGDYQDGREGVYA